MRARSIANGYINSKDEHGDTVLASAIHHRVSLDRISYLIKLGADVNNKTKDEYTLLMQGIIFNMPENVLDDLIKVGSDINVTNKYGDTPLLLSIDHLSPIEFVETLIRSDADLYAKDNRGGNVISKIVSMYLRNKYLHYVYGRPSGRDWYYDKIITRLFERGFDTSSLTDEEKYLLLLNRIDG